MDKTFEPSLLEKIAAKTGTPAYVYSAGLIRRQIRAYKDGFRPLSPLFCYAMKANSNGSVCRVIAREGFGADVVSGGELYRALKAGFHPGRIIFSGVGKTREELEYALRSKILFVNVESAEELAELEAAARRLGTVAPFSIRINPNIDPHTHRHISTGLIGSKFGVLEKEALALYARAAGSAHLKAVSVHMHLGSQISGTAPFKAAARRLSALASALAASGVRLRYADIGGGWAVPEGREMRRPSDLCAAIKSALKLPAGTGLILEPGRSVVAYSGLLLTRVIYRKSSGSRRYLIVDAAMNDLLRPAFYDARHPVEPVRPRSGPAKPFDIAGPVCESGDFLARGARMPEPANGDLLAIGSAGAYGFSMSSQYNSRPRAAEVLLESGGRFRLARRRETYRDLVRAERD